MKKFIGYNPGLMQRELQRYIDLDYDFNIMRTSSMTILKVNGNELVFSNNKNNTSEIAFIIGLVRKDIDKYYAKNGHNFSYSEYYPDVRIARIKDITKSDIMSIDIDLCYWYTLKNLGFISEKTFKRGSFFRSPNLNDALELGFIGKRNFKKAMSQKLSFKEAYNNGLVKEDCYVRATKNLKQGLVMSIGTLGKCITYDIYKSGKLIDTYIDRDYEVKYKPFHRAVLQKVEAMMYEFSEVDGFQFYVTDCVYFKGNKKPYIDIIKKYNYKYKSFKTTVVDIKGNRVTYKEELKEKGITLTFKDI